MTNTEILNKLGLYGAASSISIGGTALAVVLGQAVLPTAIAAAVGTAGTVAAACATGSAIMILPQILLSEGLNAVFPTDSYPLLNPLLSFGLQAGLIYATYTIGASIFGLSASSLFVCALVGGVILVPAAIAAIAAIGLLVVGGAVAVNAISSSLSREPSVGEAVEAVEAVEAGEAGEADNDNEHEEQQRCCC